MKEPSVMSKMTALACLVLPLLSACSVGPDYVRPSVETPARYKEIAGWKPGTPLPAGSGQAWWSVFDDPVLDGLERQLAAANQSLKSSQAAYEQALAAARAAGASFYPTIGLTASGQRYGQGTGSSKSTFATPGNQTYVANQFAASLGASWEIDVWGKIRRTVEEAESSAEASSFDLAAARLSLQSTLATDYFALRTADQSKRLLEDTVAAYERTLQITRNQYLAGTAAKTDVAQAESQLESTRAQAIAVTAQRAQLEHAIAVLVGKAPADFSLPPRTGGDAEILPEPPSFPIDLPSTLLQRRPDIAAAERRMAAANAGIGVAVSAYFPDLTLSASDGFTGAALSHLFKASNAAWSFGPQLAETLFDAGARDEAVAEARAAYDGAVANYRQTTLSAFQQVEDGLASLVVLADEAKAEGLAVDAAGEAERLSLNQYKAGTVAYTAVIIAQANALAARQSALSIRQSRLAASVALIAAIGGSPQNPAAK